MKIVLSVLLTFCWYFGIGQNTLLGIWEGALKLPQQELKIVFTFSENEGHAAALLNVPQQSPISIPADTVNITAKMCMSGLKNLKSSLGVL